MHIKASFAEPKARSPSFEIVYGAKPWKRLLPVAKIHGVLLKTWVILGKRGDFAEILMLMIWKPPGY